jgi:hypothetical protein
MYIGRESFLSFCSASKAPTELFDDTTCAYVKQRNRFGLIACFNFQKKKLSLSITVWL